MDIQAIRTEVAALLQPTRTTYDFTPGEASPPCYVVGLPDSVNPTEGSFGMLQLQLPVYALGPHAYSKEGEAQVLAMALEALAILRLTHTGTAFLSLRVVNVDRVGDMVVGSATVLSAAVNLVILATT